MAFPCFVLAKRSPYTYIGVLKVEDGATTGTVVKNVEELVRGRYPSKLGLEIQIYEVLLDPPFDNPF